MIYKDFLNNIYERILNILSNKRIYFFLLVLLGVVFSFRLIHMDSDPPSWGIAYYTPIDEGSYAALAINKYNYGEINVQSQTINSHTYSTHRVNLIGNFATYVSMKVFGDNYYGLRLPSVLWTGASLVLVFFILSQLLAEDKFKRLKILFVMFTLCTSFIYLLIGRIVEPSIVRMFFALLMCSVYVSKIKPLLKFLILGLLATMSVMLVYISNLFFFLPCLVALIIDWRKTKSRKNIFAFLIGCCIMAILGECYYRLIWHVSFLANSLDTFSGFSSVAGYESANTLRATWHNIRYFCFNNIFLYNAPLFLVGAFMAPVTLYALITKKSKELAFLTLFIIGLWIQTAHAEDYIIRKWVVIYPIFLVVLMLSLSYIEEFVNFIKTLNLKIYKWRLNFNYVFLIYYVGVVFVIFKIVLGRIFFMSGGTCFDFEPADRFMIYFIQLLPISLMFVVFMYQIIVEKISEIQIKKFVINSLIVLFSFSFLLNVYMSLKYVFLNPTYGEKSIMLDLKNRIGNDYLLGEWSYAYTLYNDIKPVDDEYSRLCYYLIKNPNLNIVLYSDYSIADPLMHGLKEKNFVLAEDAVLPREYKTFGKKRPFALYKIESNEQLGLNDEFVLLKYVIKKMRGEDEQQKND